MNLSDKKILITGAGGFIGSHLTEKLAKSYSSVRVLVRYTSDGRLGNIEEFPEEIRKRIEIFRGDLKNPDSIRRAVRGVDVVFHLGASISIPYSYQDPRDFVETNVGGTLNILEASREFGVSKLIVTSTSEVYGTAEYEPIDENHPLQPQSPYAASKVGADKITESFYKSFDLPATIIRPFNTYGPRQSMRAVIPTIIVQALTGNKIKLGSLTPKRDFTYVEDTVQGYVQIAESDNSTGEIINLGFGKTFSIGDVVRTVGRLLNKDLESIVETDEERIRPEKSEVMLLLCDNKKAKRLLGWEPKINFEEGLERTIRYIKKYLDKYSKRSETYSR
jgi:dTDP-glucose 4,6-dehydratase